MNGFLYTILVAAALASPAGVLCATPLDKASPEYSQLEAMGYEVQPPKPSDTSTIAKSMDTTLVIFKNDNGISMARYFKRERKDLDKEQMLQLLTLVNSINTDQAFQLSVQDTLLTVAVYNIGPYNPKVFASLVRKLEMSSTIFTKYPALLKLMNQ